VTVRYRVTHRTEFTYRQPVSVCHNQFHLRPRSTPRQRCAGTSLAIDPLPAVVTDRHDLFGNPTTFAIVQQVHRALAVEALSDVELAGAAPPEPSAGAPWETVRDAVRAGRDAATLERYFLTFDSPMVRASQPLREYAAPSFPAGRPLLEAAVELSSRLHHDLAYEPGSTTVGTTPDETLALGRGVCQDFAHVAIGCLRAMGLAARYVSGYLVTGRTASSDGAALTGADASHAWLSVWTPEADWVDLDPTNDLVPTDRHVTLAWGRDYGDVSPIRGVILGGGEHASRVGVEVVPVAVPL
jgi:transglutaminase-like putative cysteine protease